MMTETPLVITVSLNPAIDRIVAVPRFAVGEHQRGRLLSRTPAGKAVNVSRGLAALGVRNIATGFIGEQEIELFARSLDPERVEAQFLSVAGTTRENITIMDPIAHVETHIRDAGFIVGEADRTRLSEQLASLCRRDSIVVFSGSVPEGISPAQFVELLEVCRSVGARVAVDTSGPPLRAAAELPLWFIKPNVLELGEIVGRPLRTEAELLAAGRTLAGHIANIVISRGEAGGLCLAAGSVRKGRVPLAPERVRNTVGCGDSLVAGYIAGRIKYEDIDEAYRYALAVATASAVGVEPCRFDMKDVEEFVAMAAVESVTGQAAGGSG